MTDHALRAPAPAELTPGTWRVVPSVGHARFSVRDKLVTTVHGSLPILSGRAVLGRDGRLEEAELVLDAAAIATGNPRRDRDLAKPALLDTAAHPHVVVTTGAAPVGPDGWEPVASLSARGRTCPVALRVRLLAGGAGGAVVGVDGRLDRRGLGMKVPSVVVGRFLDLDVELLLTDAPGAPGAPGEA